MAALSRFWYLGLAATGLTALTRRLSRGGLILCYHNVVPRGVPLGDPSVHLSLERFESQMQWLSTHYDVVPLGELYRRSQDNEAHHRSAAITFDDAYNGVFQHAAPVLRSLNLPATVFVVSDAADGLPVFWWDHPSSSGALLHREYFVVTLRGDQQAILPDDRFPALLIPPRAYRPAGWNTIRAAVAAGFEIGSHSCTHRNLTQLDDRELRDEVTRSREIIARQTGAMPEWFAYPYGIWDDRVRDAVAGAGYRGAVALKTELNRPATDRFALHRVNIPSSITLPAFEAWAAGLSPRQPTAA